MPKKKFIFFSTVFVLISLVAAYTAISISGRDDTNTKEITFNDVNENDWFYDDIKYVQENGLMTGTDENLFSPGGVTTRGMIVTVLWRNEGAPKAEYNGFDDVKSDKYYYQAVSWAFDNGIVSGYDSKTFGAEDQITREQLAAIMFRYAGFKNFDTSKQEGLNKYSDKSLVSDYAVTAFKWALANKIITGTSSTTLEPQGNALRSQVAAILRRFSDLNNSGKTDVSEAADESKNVSDSISSKRGGGSNFHTGGSSTSVNLPTEKDSAIIRISEAAATPGEDVQIIAAIENNPGILGMTLNIDYDENNMQMTKAENGTIFKNKLDMTTSKELTSGARFVWDGIEMDDKDIQDGEFLIMSFHIPDSAQAGKYPVDLSYTSGDVVDNDLESVELQIEKGYITINN